MSELTPLQLFIDSASLCHNPFVLSRMLAHRYGIGWQRVAELSEHLQVVLVGPSDLVGEKNWAGVLDAWRLAEEAFSRCGSPIEELFLAHVACCGRDLFEWRKDGGVWTVTCTEIAQQVQIEGFRVDFTFSNNFCATVVELDGHDFHERTKEQAARDKSRDRRLQELGYRVLRFTGSEVWKKPWETMAQVQRFVAEPRG